MQEIIKNENINTPAATVQEEHTTSRFKEGKEGYCFHLCGWFNMTLTGRTGHKSSRDNHDNRR